MRDKAKADSTYLRFLRQIRVALGTINVQFTEPAIILMPVRSIEKKLGESGTSRAKYATHEVNILCCKFAAEPFNDDDEIVGKSNDVGLMGFHENAMAFYGGNDLSLTGLNAQYPPEVMSADDPFNQFVLETTGGAKIWMLCSTIQYFAYTVPFER
jgi:hypothetical protein